MGRGTHMNAVREHLGQVVRKKLDAHGAVVWEDPEREYADVAESVCPASARFARWDGSWYALRGELEELVDGPAAPRLIVYQPTETPLEDPLAEVRQAGTVLRHRLSTLVRDALAGKFTQDRIAELARGSRTSARGRGRVGWRRCRSAFAFQLPSAPLTRSNSACASSRTNDSIAPQTRACGVRPKRSYRGSSACPRPKRGRTSLRPPSGTSS